MNTETAATGAIRSVLYEMGYQFPLRFDLMMDNDVGIRRLAEVFGESAEKYPPKNWKKGFPESVYYNHAMEHLRRYLTGDASEDHLAHAMWNLFSLMYVQERLPELLDLTHQSWPPQMNGCAQICEVTKDQSPLVLPSVETTFEFLPVKPWWREEFEDTAWNGAGWYIIRDPDDGRMFSASIEGPYLSRDIAVAHWTGEHFFGEIGTPVNVDSTGSLPPGDYNAEITVDSWGVPRLKVK